MLIAVPLERAEDTTESRVELVRVDLLVCLYAGSEDLANVLGHLSGLRHVDRCTLQILGFGEGQTLETASIFLHLKRCEQDPALAFLAGTTGTSNTMDISVAIAGKTNLDHVSDIWKIHSTCCNVGGE